MVSLKKIWYFIWKDESMLSWFVNIILAIIIVKFLIYPALGLILNTSFPVVAVVSCSMEHGITNCDNNRVPDLCGVSEVANINDFDDYWDVCGSWYEDRNITQDEFSEYSFKDGFNKGDIMVLTGVNFDKLNKGDVVVFSAGAYSAPIIHRVVDKTEDGIGTKGDHNIDQNSFEKDIKKDRLLGKAVLRIPYLGWVKVMFSDLIGR